MSKPAKLTVPSQVRLTVAGIAGLAAAYVFASLAIDRGNPAYYGLTLMGLYVGLRYLYRGFQVNKKK